MNGLLEIQTTNKWLIDRDFGLKAMRMVNAMMNGHLLREHDDKVYGVRCYEQANGEFAAMAADENGGQTKSDAPFINVLYVEGPITREGGACTYGSRQLRDMMMEAADYENCLGHLLLINGPGGVSTAIPDMMQATDYARSKGQPIVGRIDGFCASAHIWIATMCDELYYNNPTDMMGSVGIYYANITNKDGDVDPETGGTWHIVYDPESYDKNKPYRDLADNNDDTLIKEELIRDGAVFRNYMKSRRPNVTEEHLHGKMFECKDVEGILVDGQATMQEAFNRVVALSGKRNGGKSGKTGRMASAQGNDNILSTQINSINMKEKFPALFAALQVEEMQMQEDGAFMNEGLLATLNAAIEASQKEATDAKALAEQLTNEKAELEQKLETANSDHTAAVETLNADHQKAIDDLKAEHQTKVDEMNSTIEEKQNAIAALEQEKADLQGEVNAKAEQMEQMTNDLNGSKAALETAQQTIAERDQQISDLNAQVEELQRDPGNTPQAGAAPQNNGSGAEAPSVAVAGYVYDAGKSYEENMRLKRQFEQGK